MTIHPLSTGDGWTIHFDNAPFGAVSDTPTTFTGSIKVAFTGVSSTWTSATSNCSGWHVAEIHSSTTCECSSYTAGTCNHDYWDMAGSYNGVRNYRITQPSTADWRTTFSQAVARFNWYGSVKSRKESIQEMLKRRQFPAIRSRLRPPGHTEDIREVRARDTLRRCIGDRAYQRFLTKGNICVRAKSGLVYQISPGNGLTRVYKDGVCIERMCVVLSGNFPPTDSLIARFLIIVNNEQLFRSKANISHSVEDRIGHGYISVRHHVEPMTLVEEVRKLARVG
jgi:hypothetical protein